MREGWRDVCIVAGIYKATAPRNILSCPTLGCDCLHPLKCYRCCFGTTIKYINSQRLSDLAFDHPIIQKSKRALGGGV